MTRIKFGKRQRAVRETTETELEALQDRADRAGCYCNRHRFWDPTRGRGDLWLQWKRRFRDDRGPDLDLLRYASAAEVTAALVEIEAQPRDRRRSDMRLSFRRVVGRMVTREQQDEVSNRRV
jgi:hypothetical protein